MTRDTLITWFCNSFLIGCGVIIAAYLFTWIAAPSLNACIFRGVC